MKTGVVWVRVVQVLDRGDEHVSDDAFDHHMLVVGELGVVVVSHSLQNDVLLESLRAPLDARVDPDLLVDGLSLPLL